MVLALNCLLWDPPVCEKFFCSPPPRLLFDTKFGATAAVASSCRSGELVFIAEDMIGCRQLFKNSSPFRFKGNLS